MLSNNPSTIGPDESLTVHFPDLQESQVIVAGTTKLTFNISLSTTDANRTLVKNLGRNIIRKLVVNIKGSDHCFIGDLGKIPGWSETHLTGCISEISGFYRSLTDEENSYIHQYLMTKWA